MTLRTPSQKQVAFCVALAFIFWTLVFGLKIVNFWAGLSFAACFLVFLSVRFAGFPLSREEIHLKNIVVGVGSAGLLYAIFALCYWLAGLLLPFAGDSVAGIYQIRTQANPWLIAAVLIFITSPAEELFWRGFLQRWSMKRFGEKKGWIFASLCYAGVHLASFNLMLIGAALVAGLFWGYLYMQTKSIFACIISHALWTVAIFILWPMG